MSSLRFLTDLQLEDETFLFRRHDICQDEQFSAFSFEDQQQIITKTKKTFNLPEKLKFLSFSSQVQVPAQIDFQSSSQEIAQEQVTPYLQEGRSTTNQIIESQNDKENSKEVTKEEIDQEGEGDQSKQIKFKVMKHSP